MPENVGFRTFTSRDVIGGGIGSRFSDYTNNMHTFASKATDIQGYIRDIPEVRKKRRPVDEESTDSEDELDLNTLSAEDLPLHPSWFERNQPEEFTHFLLDNRAELTEEEKVIVRGVKNKVDSVRVYHKSRADAYESRKEGDWLIILIWFFVGCCSCCLCCCACGAWWAFLCTAGPKG